VDWGIALLRGPGRLSALVVIAGALALRIIDPGVVTELRVRGFDLAERIWPRTSDVGQVEIVDIDEKSFAQYGPWPWPRHMWPNSSAGSPKGTRAFSVSTSSSPNEIGFHRPRSRADLPGLSPALAERWRSCANDHDLAEALAAVPTVLALVPSREQKAQSSDPPRLTAVRQGGDDPMPFLKSYKSLVLSQPDLSAAASAAGAITSEPDADGVVRRLALAVAFQQTIVPSFALEVVRIGAREHSIVINTGALGIQNITIGGATIPTDRRGRAILHFATPLARYVSAADVLDRAFDLAEFQGQVVLLGVAGLGVAGLRETPLGLVRAVDLDAQLIDSILLRTLLRRPAYLEWFELAAALLAGLAVGWSLHYARPVRAVVIAVAIVVAFWASNCHCFALQVSSLIAPSGAADSAGGVGCHAGRQPAQCRSGTRPGTRGKARIEGELSAARAIQMGLLPGHP
jgi:adenylate cyclase